MKQKEKLCNAPQIKTQDYKNWAQFQPLHWTQLQNCSTNQIAMAIRHFWLTKKSLRV